jgi:hypothetical protein
MNSATFTGWRPAIVQTPAVSARPIASTTSGHSRVCHRLAIFSGGALLAAVPQLSFDAVAG